MRRAWRTILAWAALGCAPAATEPALRAEPEPVASPAPATRDTPDASPAPGGEDAPADAGVAANAAWPPPAPGVETDWCLPGVDALDEGTCYVLPERPTRELLVYLHGIVPPERVSAQKTNLQTVVARAARRAGVAALIPRGERGLAPKGHERWWGWPTDPAAHRRLAPALVARIEDRRRRLERLIGAEMERVWVAGSSSGAYFAAGLAVHGELVADGWGVMSGGSPVLAPELDGVAPKPAYIGFGVHDSVAKSARALGDQLQRAGWPVRIAAHPVGHGAKEIYLDEAFAFWRSARPR